MNNGIIDSSVLIDCLRGTPTAVAYLAAVAASGQIATHVIAAAELYVGARDKREQAAIESFLSAFDLVLPTEADGQMALDLFKAHRLSDGVDWPDCQIAATAIRLDVEVHTLNTKHFKAFAGLRVLKAY